MTIKRSGVVTTSFDDAGGSMSLRPRWVAVAAALVLTVLPVPHAARAGAADAGAANAGPTLDGPALDGPALDGPALVRFRLPDEAMLRRLVAAGEDLAARP